MPTYEPNALSILPPLLAILLAIATRQVVISLGIGIWAAFCLLHALDPLRALPLALDGVINVFADPGDTRVLVFTLVIGGLIATIERTGGVRGFIRLLENSAWVDNARRAKWLAFFTGVVVFVESNITLLVAGAISRPLFDHYRISREKLAYIIDSTSAPICILIPLNAWGAVVLGLLSAAAIDNPVAVFITAIPLNFYALLAILCCAFAIWRDLDLGPMRAAEQRAANGQVLWPNAAPMVDPSILASREAAGEADRARYMIAPIATMVLCMPVALHITGDGDIAAGSGSTSVLWAVLLALACCWLLALFDRRASVDELMRTFLRGAGGLLPVAVILLFALALGDAANLLGTGTYAAQFAREAMPLPLLLPLLFLLSAFIAFAIGSSWGCFAIMIPLAMQIALSLELEPGYFLAAVLSGSIFGDHASPISDTTVVASMASATDHIDHVRTQLPYALGCAALATCAFFLLGLFAF